jgi:hypothetical protein
MLSHGRHTGYHGGMWRWSFEPADGGLTWRGRAYDRARDSFFLEHGLDDRLVYLGTETIDDQGFGRVALAMAVGPGGALAPLAETRIDAPASAVADPSGTFVWLATGWTAGTTRLDAYRPEANGALGRPESADWQRPAPVVHPSGRVLYAASPTHVEAYAVDPVTGRPRLSARVAFAAADRLPLAVHPQGRFVYVAAPTEVHAFRAEADGRLEDYGRVAPGGTRLVTVRPQ